MKDKKALWLCAGKQGGKTATLLRRLISSMDLPGIIEVRDSGSDALTKDNKLLGKSYGDAIAEIARLQGIIDEATKIAHKKCYRTCDKMKLRELFPKP
jgi:hypothetical protein